MPTTKNPRNVFELFHLKQDAPEGRDIRFGIGHATRRDQLEQVADFFSLPDNIDGDRNDIEPILGYLYAITQNVDRPWIEVVSADDADPDLAVFAPGSPIRNLDKPLRSTSVGDVFLDVRTETFYAVMGMGFKKITLS